MPAAIAPLMAGWDRLTGGQPGPLASASGEAPNGLLVEILVDGAWMNITDRVMVRDNSGSISGSRGQTSEGQQPVPGTCTFQLNNRDGRFSPANPVSDLWEKIGRNAQMRWSVPNGEQRSTRLWGQVPAWPEDWDTTGKDVWTDVQAYGILRHLNQGVSALDSALRRAIPDDPALVAYWAVEDTAGSTQAASALPGAPAMQTIGLTFGADSSLAASSPLATLGAKASIAGTVPAYADTGAWRVELVFRVDQPLTADVILFAATTTGGDYRQWWVTLQPSGDVVIGRDAGGVILLEPITNNPSITGIWQRIVLEVKQGGGNLTIGFAQVDDRMEAGGYVEFTRAGTAAGRVTSITSVFDAELEGMPIGHVAVYSSYSSDRLHPVAAGTGYTGETASDRLQRLCAEKGVGCTLFGESTDAMGPQRPAEFLALVQECVDVDQGILLEDTTQFGLAYKTRKYLCNQPAALTLSYPGGQLAGVPVPVPDDANLHNLVTAFRPSGSSATAAQETGRLSVLDPPLGVGEYPDTPTINVATDADLAQHAAWRVHLGTVDEPRYPAISINLASPAVDGLRAAALRVVQGDRIVITDPPGRLGGDISQIVIGIQESKAPFEHRLTFVCEPESPYRTAVLNDPVRGRLNTAGAVLAGDMTPTSTTVLVATTAGPLWTTNPAKFPFDVTIGGEQMTVTNIAGASSPQTFTVTRSVNGVAKTHQVGDTVTLTRPMTLGL